MDFEDYEEALANAGDIRADLKRRDYHLVTDVVEEMHWRACFQPERARAGGVAGSSGDGSQVAARSTHQAKKKADSKRKMADASRRRNRK